MPGESRAASKRGDNRTGCRQGYDPAHAASMFFSSTDTASGSAPVKKPPVLTPAEPLGRSASLVRRNSNQMRNDMVNRLPVRNEFGFQWMIAGPNTFQVCGRTTDISRRARTRSCLDNCGNPVFQGRDLQADELIHFPDSLPAKVQSEIKTVLGHRRPLRPLRLPAPPRLPPLRQAGVRQVVAHPPDHLRT